MKKIITLTESDIRRLISEAIMNLRENDDDEFHTQYTDYDDDDDTNYDESSFEPTDEDNFEFDDDITKPLPKKKSPRNPVSVEKFVSDWYQAYMHLQEHPEDKKAEAQEKQAFANMVVKVGEDKRINFIAKRSNAVDAKRNKDRKLRQIEDGDAQSMFNMFMLTDHTEVMSKSGRGGNDGGAPQISIAQDDLKLELASAYHNGGMTGFWSEINRRFTTYCHYDYAAQIQGGASATNGALNTAINGNPRIDVDRPDEKINEPTIGGILERIMNDYKNHTLKLPQGVRFNGKVLYSMMQAYKRLENNRDKLNIPANITDKQLQMVMMQIAYKIYASSVTEPVNEQSYYDSYRRTIQTIKNYILPEYRAKMYDEMNEAKRRRQRRLAQIINETIAKILKANQLI